MSAQTESFPKYEGCYEKPLTLETKHNKVVLWKIFFLELLP